MIREASLDDIGQVKALADRHKDTLGFVLRPALENAAMCGSLLVATEEGDLRGRTILGFVHVYYRKRDRQATVYELCVTERAQGQGYGRKLLEEVRMYARARGKTHIMLKAVVGIPANGFYEHLGFELVRQEPGKRRELNVWRWML